MFRITVLIGILLFPACIIAAERGGYISDNVYLFLHGGPGKEYRIRGSIEAGQPITTLGEQQGKYSKIVDHKGREGWILTEMISRKKSFRILNSEIKAKLATTQAELEAAVKSGDNTTKELQKTKSALSKTQRELDRSNQERDRAVSQLRSIEKNERFQLWKEGGIIGGIGILVGIILVYLPRPRRKPKNRW